MQATSSLLVVVVVAVDFMQAVVELVVIEQAQRH
jgi:hypothetical protein